jgi:hypothetical protein
VTSGDGGAEVGEREAQPTTGASQTVLVGDLQVVELHSGEFDRDDVGVLALGDVDRRCPRRAGHTGTRLLRAQQVQDPASQHLLHQFLRSLPEDLVPTLGAHSARTARACASLRIRTWS